MYLQGASNINGSTVAFIFDVCCLSQPVSSNNYVWINSELKKGMRDRDAAKRKATERDRYFLHSKFAFTRESFMSLPGLTGLRNNPKNCHYLVENIPTVEDINKEYLLLYPVWLLC